MKRPLLYLLVGSIGIAVVLGISIVLRNEWSWFEVRVILTTLTVAAASICGLACDISRALRGYNILPRVGIVLTVIAAGLILTAMWKEPSSEVFWKSTVCAVVLALATAHACLLSVARVARRFRLVQMAAYQVIFGLALLICAALVWEIDNPRMWQLIAAVSILDAGLTLVLPILHRISKTDPTTPTLSLFEERNVAAIDGEILQLKRRIAELEKLRAEVAGGA